MKNLKLKAILLFSVLTFSIACFSQTTSSDTLCFTVEQVNFFIGQSFTIKQQEGSLSAKDAVIVEDEAAIAELQHNVQLQIDEVKNCETDSKFDKDTIKTLTRKVKGNKVLAYLLGIVAVFEAGAYVVKK